MFSLMSWNVCLKHLVSQFVYFTRWYEVSAGRKDRFSHPAQPQIPMKINLDFVLQQDFLNWKGQLLSSQGSLFVTFITLWGQLKIYTDQKKCFLPLHNHIFPLKWGFCSKVQLKESIYFYPKTENSLSCLKWG